VVNEVLLRGGQSLLDRCVVGGHQIPRILAPTLSSGDIISTLRRRRDEELDEETAGAMEEPTDDPGMALEKKDKSAMIRKCLLGLSVEHREIIDLVYYHEKSVKEVAEIVRIPENTVKTRMFYARRRLAS